MLLNPILYTSTIYFKHTDYTDLYVFILGPFIILCILVFTCCDLDERILSVQNRHQRGAFRIQSGIQDETFCEII